MLDGPDLLERLRELPGGRELLALAADRDDVELVGGAVRDLLLRRPPRELDVVVGRSEEPFLDEAPLFARDLASALGSLSGSKDHERFGTARVRWDAGEIDVAGRRAESYATHGALPSVKPGTPKEDLDRRDFTVNAIALALGAAHKGELRCDPRALDDLEAGRLRVLHDESFLQDPTRLLRLARYAGRLGFEVEVHTAELARQALAGGALATVSGARVGAELRLALEEDDRLAALGQLDRLQMLGALHPRLRFEEPLLAAALELLPPEGRPDLLALAALALPLVLRAEENAGVELQALLDRWQFPAPDRDRVLAGAFAVPRLLEQLPACASPAALRATVANVPLEGVALAGALGQVSASASPMLAEMARRWLDRLWRVKLSITGEDLLAAGVPSGPEIGRLLAETLDRRLNGELPDGAEAELKAALALR